MHVLCFIYFSPWTSSHLDSCCRGSRLTRGARHYLHIYRYSISLSPLHTWLWMGPTRAEGVQGDQQDHIMHKNLRPPTNPLHPVAVSTNCIHKCYQQNLISWNKSVMTYYQHRGPTCLPVYWKWMVRGCGPRTSYNPVRVLRDKMNVFPSLQGTCGLTKFLCSLQDSRVKIWTVVSRDGSCTWMHKKSQRNVNKNSHPPWGPVHLLPQWPSIRPSVRPSIFFRFIRYLGDLSSNSGPAHRLSLLQGRRVSWMVKVMMFGY